MKKINLLASAAALAVLAVFSGSAFAGAGEGGSPCGDQPCLYEKATKNPICFLTKKSQPQEATLTKRGIEYQICMVGCIIPLKKRVPPALLKEHTLYCNPTMLEKVKQGKVKRLIVKD